jgi:hypothetical protein
LFFIAWPILSYAILQFFVCPHFGSINHLPSRVLLLPTCLLIDYCHFAIKTFSFFSILIYTWHLIEVIISKFIQNGLCPCYFYNIDLLKLVFCVNNNISSIFWIMDKFVSSNKVFRDVGICVRILKWKHFTI